MTIDDRVQDREEVFNQLVDRTIRIGGGEGQLLAPNCLSSARKAEESIEARLRLDTVSLDGSRCFQPGVPQERESGPLRHQAADAPWPE